MEAIRKVSRYLDLCKSCISLKDKLIILFLMPLISLLYSLESIGREKVLYEKFCSIYNPIVTVKNEDGLFRCRAWTGDMLIVSPVTELEIRKYFLFKDGIFIDVGAHIGKYTVMVGKQLKIGKIVSIEADSENFRMLKENIALNDLKNVTALNLAAFRENGEVSLYRTISRNTGVYSIYSSGNTQALNVRAMKLDDIIDSMGFERVDLLKIDVESAEYDVLLGAMKTLRITKMVIFEALWGEKSEKCKELLIKMGFKIEDTGNNIVAIK